jgi:hypothetical protein
MKNFKKTTRAPLPTMMLFRVFVFVLALFISDQLAAQKLTHMPEISNPFQQGFPTTRFEGSGKIVLDMKTPLSEFYVADAAGLNTDNDDEVLMLLNKIAAENRCQFMFDLNARKILIYLDTKNAEAHWGVKQWNDYLNTMLNQ